MALRGRTPTSDDGVDRSYDSSPDPLALSMNGNTATSTSKTSRRKALVSTSPSKQNRQSSVSEVEFSSPSKAMVMSTPRMGSASPWRIKVTVQAEPGSEEENEGSPSVKRIMRTQTTKIPLKDPDAPSSPVKRGRGRPKKSDVGAASKPKRAGTPVKRAARSKSREPSVGAADASAADVDTDAPPKRKRGRPRKSLQPPEDEDTIMVQESQNDNEPRPNLTPLPAAKPDSPTSRKTTLFATPQASIPAIETTNATPQPPASMLPQDKKQNGTCLMLPADGRRRKALADYELPVVDTPPQTGLGKRLRARKGTPHSKTVIPVSISSDDESDQDSDVLTPTSGEEDAEPEKAVQNPFNTQPAGDEPSNHLLTQLDTSQPILVASAKREEQVFPEQPVEDDDDEEIQDVTNFVFDEGATRMPDDTTVIDSENFSMISVDSLPSSVGLTSTPQPQESSDAVPRSGSIVRHEYLRPDITTISNSTSQASSKTSPAPVYVPPGLKLTEGPSRPALRRYITPIIDAAALSAPPVIEQVQAALPKTETPRLGRVVTAGVALQGVLDPSRLTPEPSQKMLDEKRDRLDDLFRGFSEGTRRELQAGLRLGEQLAQGHTTEQSPLVPSEHTELKPEAISKEGVFRTQRKLRHSRLLTPEDQDDDVVTPVTQPEVNDVQYPSLDVATTEKSLPSPARSEDGDEMSWRMDTPPVATGSTERMRSVAIVDPFNEACTAPGPAVTLDVGKSTQQEDYSDIWQEEASRSSNSAEFDETPQEQDLFGPGFNPPARGKLPRTWRRKSGNHFQYSDEVESPQQPTQAPTESAPEIPEVLVDDVVLQQEQEEDEDAASDASDDTGMFFQSNLPNIFSKRHSRDLKKRKDDKLDLTLLLNEGESIVPESSPPVVTKKSSATKANPFLNTPPRFLGFPSSPKKSSPLRRELRGSDISSASPSHIQDESSLPLPQSSPFNTYVDGDSILSVASDQRQLQMEMEGVTDSSIRRVRNEANKYLDAYEPQERSLHEIEEVTEPSRTWHKHTSMIEPSPPQMKMLSPVRKRVPLFQSTPEKPRFALHREAEPEVMDENRVHKDSEASSSPAEEQILTVGPPQQRPTGLLTRMTSSLWSAVTRPAAVIVPSSSSAPPTPHPILPKLTPLPKIEPWTKTHYKTLDKLYQINQKHPALFSPSITPATPLSQTNTHLLDKFLSANKQPYVGAVFSAWGYEFDMNEELVVLCQVFCELMNLESIEAYEVLKGRHIEMGDCLPGRTGELIAGEEVVRRLATVILGEEVRADERIGVEIDRSKGLEVTWPQ